MLNSKSPFCTELLIKDVVPPLTLPLISFDVIGLFPNIPEDSTIQNMGELLMETLILHETIFLNFSTS